MNIYLITQNVVNDYDTFDSAVVVAESKEAAASMHPGGDTIPQDCNYSWTNDPKDVSVQFLGVADAYFAASMIICSSFNAG